MPIGRVEYSQLDEHDSSLVGDDALSPRQEQQPRRGVEYAELEISEPTVFGEEDDARFHEEFSTYDTRSAKAQSWRRKRFSLAHICMVAIGCLGLYAILVVVWRTLASHSGDGSSVGMPGAHSDKSDINSQTPINRSRKRLLTYDNVNRVTSLVETKSLNWVAHPSDSSIDGLHRDIHEGFFVVHKADNSTWEHKLAEYSDVKKAALGLMETFVPQSWSVSADWEYLLFNVHSEHVWRHSVKGTYFLYNIKEKTMIPLTSTRNNKIQRVEWAPVGHQMLFVRDNNLFVTDMMHEIQVTEDGSDEVFNGLADWVYEEEVLGSGASSWWSPDGKALAYLRLDDSKVPVFQYELFHPDNSSVVYPSDIRLHYPKPGASNPLVALFVYQLGFGKDSGQDKATSKARDSADTDYHPHPIVFEKLFSADDTIITNVAWLTNEHDRLIVHVMNRVQDQLKVYLANTDPKQLSAKLVRERNTSESGGDGAWIEITSTPIFVPKSSVQSLTSDGYISLVENGEHTHLALFSPPDAAQPTIWLTSGDYDVVGGSVSFSRKTARVSFLSSQASTIKFNLYEVSLNSDGTASQPRALSPPTLKSSHDRLNSEGARDGNYDASYSIGAGFYTLSYKGPRLPWQAVYSTTDANFELVLADNSNAQNELSLYDLPTVEYLEIPNEAGDKMNAMVIFPPGVNKSAKSKYGVLFRVYGGPNSQQVSQSFSLDWHSALVSQQDVPDMPWIVATVDGRGTGYKGRKFRSSVSKQLGVFEPADQAAGAKYFQGLEYVNPHRIAIWGWSYGGYTTSRAIERHSDVFRVGMAVAPVTNWRFYDSIYTERYMKTPEINADGYKNSTVSNATAFGNAKFLIQHGTGDDNVHLQNTLALVDLLQSNNVPGFEMATYTDSDHGIYTHNVRSALYARMTNFLFRSFHELENKEFDFWRHSDPNEMNSSESTSNHR
ncbi:Dpp4p [Coemansia aciculifera]|uniref:Dpp4p n=1 Tax=Coemansia aciculifera TaxID=417176 RepID=A0A9W8IRY7_9FUNG|nr:Dpp4p [Coemansia aciculifera]